MAVSDAVTLRLRGLEEQLLQPAVRENAVAAGELIADDFLEIGQSGRTYDKAEILEAMVAEPLEAPVSVERFEARGLAADVVLVTYRCKATLRSSIWRQNGGRWQIVFHQGTPLR